MPPAAAYGFRLQPDGTFGEPFVIGFDMDGYSIGFDMDGYSVAPFGFSFVTTQSDTATVVFSHADIREFEEKGLTPNLYVADIRLGEPVVLGRFECSSAEGITLDDDRTERLALLPHSDHSGNPFLESGRSRVWFDDESSDCSLVYFSTLEGDTWSERTPAHAPVNVDGQASYQPFLHDDRQLFWASDFRSIQSALLTGDPSDPESWSGHEVELALAPPTGSQTSAPPGQIVALGEPSVAHGVDDLTWLYFVSIRRTEAGYNADIARVSR